MGSSRPIRIGARGSPLSLAQTRLFAEHLAAANQGLSYEIVPVTTTGDRILDRSLVDSGGKGLFTKELDEALLDKRIDLAVHSMKDLPTQLPNGVELACTPKREDPRDALICSTANSLLELPEDAKIGTASLRRQAQLLALRPTFNIVMLRGNVGTRLRKVADAEVDATLLAYAGLKRLGLTDHVKALIDPIQAPPAAGQGALAVTAFSEGGELHDALARVEDRATRLEVSAERAFLAALDGSCRTPIAALGRWSNGILMFVGETLTPDGVRTWRRTAKEPCQTEAAAAALGARLGDDILSEVRHASFTDRIDYPVGVDES
jgi:hydroxymethylbilane synthase